MVRIRVKEGLPPRTLMLSDGTWQEITRQWTEFEDALINDKVRRKREIEIEDIATSKVHDVESDAITITPALGSEPQPDFDDTIDPFGGDVTAMREAVEEVFSTEEIAKPGDSVSKAVSKPTPRRRASRPRKARS